MKAYSSCSGGVMFVPDDVERATNKQQKPKSYKEIAGETEKPFRDKILGVFKINKTKANAA